VLNYPPFDDAEETILYEPDAAAQADFGRGGKGGPRRREKAMAQHLQRYLKDILQEAITGGR